MPTRRPGRGKAPSILVKSGGHRVLVITRDPGVRRLVAQALAELECVVEAVNNVAGARAEGRRAGWAVVVIEESLLPAAAEPGRALAPWRTDHEGPPVIVLSASRAPRRQAKLLMAAGADLCSPLPVDPRFLAGQVNALMGLRKPGPAEAGGKAEEGAEDAGRPAGRPGERTPTPGEASSEAFLDGLPGIAYRCRGDAERTLLLISQGCEQVTGYRAEEFLRSGGIRLLQIVHPDDRAGVAAELGAALGERRAFRLTYRIRTRAGEERWCGEQGEGVFNGRGQLEYVRGFVMDISERKRLETQFYRSHRMESLGRLASGVAHDLNNILTPIAVSAPMLRWGMSAAEQEQTIATIEASAQRGAEIVRQLLTFGRGAVGERSSVQVRLLVKEVVKLAQETFPRDIRLQTDLPVDLWPVMGDATQLHQVLLNLFVNARDAMAAGGSLSVVGSNVEVDEPFASMYPDLKPGPHLRLLVIDTGQGIAPEVIDKIFDPFFTTKELGRGTGLGLATVLGIVQSHGGSIGVRSRPGQGSTFEIYLPASPQRTPAPAPAPRPSRPRAAGELVLLVDDEARIREATQRSLEGSGYRVVSAADGAEAAALFAQYALQIQCVFTDLMMPVMDGVALIRAVRRIRPSVPILATTGLHEESRLAELRTLQVRHVLPKPYSTDQLLDALGRVVETGARPAN